MVFKKPEAYAQVVPGGHIPRGRHRRPWVWRVGICVFILVVIAIVVPIAVVLSKRRKSPTMGPKSNVIVPLYVYPGTAARDWSPLFQAANTTSALNFTVIVNPNNGPGSDELPDPNYIAGITRLNALSNVRTLGYVHTTYTTRDIDLVLNDVNTYSNWAKNNSKLAVDGIFFDETPWQYTDTAASYISRIHDAAKSASGITHEKMIVFNPGTVPSGGPLYPSTGVVVAFEDTYDAYQRADLTVLSTNRTQYSFMVHSVPSSANLQQLVSSMAQNADYLFITDVAGHNDSNPYDKFSSIWSTFIQDMPETM